MAIEVKCHHCGRSFMTWPCILKIGKAKYCSQSCARSGSNSPTWIRGWSIDGGGYKRVYVTGIPKWSNRKSEHRLVFEKLLGRELKANELVHHKDGNRQNNKLENLELMSRSEHSKIHAIDRWSRVRSTHEKYATSYSMPI